MSTDAAIGLDARLDSLLRECGRHEELIYKGDGVAAAESLPFLCRVSSLLEALSGFTSLCRYDDVMEMLDEAAF
jgi:hypothetical protein